MTTGHVLMGLLSKADRHGYDLKHEHDHLFPTSRPLAFGQIYAALERLNKKGFVGRVSTDPSVASKGPERIVFTLLPEGRAELDRWLSEIEAPAPFVSNPLAAKATVALVSADRSVATTFLEHQRTAHLDRMREYTRMKLEADVSLADALAADYAISHLDADVRWIETALERISTLEEELPI